MQSIVPLVIRLLKDEVWDELGLFVSEPGLGGTCADH